MDYKKVLEKIPFNPGIYLMKNIEGTVIYVGKAKSLKKRVRQYFNKTNKTVRIQKMVEQIENIEYIITNNEVEALVLECNYIKEYMPKYNVMLKDDKTYPYIKITIKDKYPLVFSTRRKVEDGSIYFGPYTDVSSLNSTMKMIKETFSLKRCKYNLNKPENKSVGPCLYYHIGRCMGPCINDIKQIEYKDMINEIILFLQGKTKEVENKIKNKIDKYIEKLEFEKAGALKERLESINKIHNKQNVGNINVVDTDVWGYILIENVLHVQVFKIRMSKISGHDNFTLRDIAKDNIEEIMVSVLAQYYSKINNIPKEIYIRLMDTENIKEEIDILQNYLSNFRKSSVKIFVPKRGNKLNLIKMAENNIYIKLDSKEMDNLVTLQNILKLDKKIEIIEAYDISNLKNDYIVGTYITIEKGKLNKNKYRKFKIKSIETQNDVMSLQEIMRRRIGHIDDWNMPDVIAIDGGKGQVRAVKEVLKEYNIDIPIIGMIKDNNHRTRGIIDLEEKEIDLRDNEKNKKLLNFLTFIQDEVHRFTITYHRKLRDSIK